MESRSFLIFQGDLGSNLIQIGHSNARNDSRILLQKIFLVFFEDFNGLELLQAVSNDLASAALVMVSSNAKSLFGSENVLHGADSQMTS